jgi:hypothetical protein
MPHGRVVAFSVACLAISTQQLTARACPAAIEHGRAIMPAPDLVLKPGLDPVIFFASVAQRYGDLETYEDRVSVEHVVQREGRRDHRVETTLACTLRGDDLVVHSPASQARRALGLDGARLGGAAVRSLREQYSLWLVPHMAMRSAVREEHEADSRDWKFRPIAAEPFIHDGRRFVHVELAGVDSSSEREPDRLVMDVDEETLLVERLLIEERLPDGGLSSRRMQITPLVAESASEKRPPQVSAGTPASEAKAREKPSRTASNSSPASEPSGDEPGRPAKAPFGRTTTTPPR